MARVLISCVDGKEVVATVIKLSNEILIHEDPSGAHGKLNKDAV